MLAREGHDLLNLSIRSDFRNIILQVMDKSELVVFKNRIRKLYYGRRNKNGQGAGTIKMWKNNRTGDIWRQKKTPPRGGRLSQRIKRLAKADCRTGLEDTSTRQTCQRVERPDQSYHPGQTGNEWCCLSEHLPPVVVKLASLRAG